MSTEATFTTDYGDQRTVHKTRHGWQLKREVSTVPLTANRVVGPLIGKKIRQKRLECGMSQTYLCRRAGITTANTPKQRMHEIESGARAEGLRMGTLYAIAFALGTEAAELMPSVAEVMEAAGITVTTYEALALPFADDAALVGTIGDEAPL